MARSLASSIAATLALLVCAPISVAAQPNPVTAIDPGNMATAVPAEIHVPPILELTIAGGNIAGALPWQVELYTTHVYDEADFVRNEQLPETDENRGRLRPMPNWERIHRCGGAYIGDMWVLTAAHCVLRDPLESVLSERRVRAGTQSLTEGGTTYRIERVVIHEDYDFDTKLHDIALVRIVADADTDEPAAASLRAIRLLGSKPNDPPLANLDPVNVSGWGLTGARAVDSVSRGLDGFPLNSSSVLMEVTLTNFPQSRCAAVPAYLGFLGESVLCVGSDVAGRDSCNGDSGGPLMRKVGEEWVLVGVVSWAKGCGLPDIPGIYTSIAAHAEWITAAKNARAGQVTRM